MKRLSMHRSLQPFSLLAVFCTALALFASASAIAQNTSAKPEPRITSAIDSSSRVSLPGSRSPRAAAADDLGAVPDSLQLHGISLLFSRSAAQQTALDALVAAQQNPASPLYHQWITPDQYAAQFGVADSDLAAAEAWLEQQGFAIDSVSRSHNRILFSGTAAQVAAAFGTPLHYYLTPATALRPAEKHFAPSADLTLPSALASSVLAISNLSDFHLLPHIVRRAPQPAQPRFTSSATGNHYLTPGDLATIYDITPAWNSGYTGSNQSIAVIGQSAVNLSDIANFQNAVGIPGKTPIVVLVPDTGTSAIVADGDEAESDLDLEYSSTIAKGAQVYFVYTGNNNNFGAFDSIVYAIDQKIAPIISSSYGDCEPNLGGSSYRTYNASLEQAAAQGQTVVSAAGDEGSTDCYGEYKSTQAALNEQLAVDFPGSSQYVTAVGGTEFPAADVATGTNTYFDAQSSTDIISSAKSYIPEMVWNDDVAAASSGCPGTNCTPLSSGGGGVSIFTTQPSWQSGTIGGVAISTTGGQRMVPDIAMTASPYNAPLAFCTSDKTFWETGARLAAAPSVYATVPPASSLSAAAPALKPPPSPPSSPSSTRQRTPPARASSTPPSTPSPPPPPTPPPSTTSPRVATSASPAPTTARLPERPTTLPFPATMKPPASAPSTSSTCSTPGPTPATSPCSPPPPPLPQPPPPLPPVQPTPSPSPSHRSSRIPSLPPALSLFRSTAAPPPCSLSAPE